MKAKPIEDCLYPNCEECDKYRGRYCTVPIVVNKQIFFMLGDKVESMDNSIKELEKLVMDEILGEDEDDEDEEGFTVLTEKEYNRLPPLQKWWYDKWFQDTCEAIESADSLKSNENKDKSGETVKIRKYAPLSDFKEKLP